MQMVYKKRQNSIIDRLHGSRYHYELSQSVDE